MATPSENLAASLGVLKTLQDQEMVAIRTSHLTRTHRERLLKRGFLREVVKGWYIPTRPIDFPGESTDGTRLSGHSAPTISMNALVRTGVLALSNP